MTLKEWTVVALVFIGCVFTFYKACTKNAVGPSVPLTLKADEKAIVRVGPTRIETLERTKDGKETVHKDEPNYHHGEDVIVKEDGSIKMVQKTQGFGADFGLSVTYNAIGVGTEFYYYKDLALLGGSQFLNFKTQRPQLNLWVAVAYRLPMAKLNNVSVYTGFDTDRHVIAGLFLRLGNS